MNTLLSIEEPLAPKHTRTEFALFRLVFRPFFLFGSVFSIFALAYFILWMSGIISTWPSAWDALIWHRHEMLFGYTGAIIAGFLLTAVPNWTGYPTPKGRNLMLLALLWLAGRVVVLFSASLPASLVAVIDVSFFAACAASIAPALIKSKNHRNYFFILLLAGLSVANGLTHTHADESAELAALGITLALDIIIIIMLIIGGRVIPFFTERPLGISIPRNPRLEKAALIATILGLAVEVSDVSHILAGVLLMASALLNGWRLATWHSLKTLRVPLLWVLHLGFAWIVVGLALKGVELTGMEIPPIIATHAFTAGGIGVLTLSMMAQVSLGHSGRPLLPANP
ncbi:MAG: NnrS family protein [Rickettsiales bacterium]